MEAGFELPIEVTRAQLTAAQVEQRMAQLEDQEETAADQLRSLLGLEPDQPIEVAAEDIPAAADQTINDLVTTALRDNPEMKQAESERMASEVRLQGRTRRILADDRPDRAVQPSGQVQQLRPIFQQISAQQFHRRDRCARFRFSRRTRGRRCLSRKPI